MPITKTVRLSCEESGANGSPGVQATLVSRGKTTDAAPKPGFSGRLAARRILVHEAAKFIRPRSLLRSNLAKPLRQASVATRSRQPRPPVRSRVQRISGSSVTNTISVVVDRIKAHGFEWPNTEHRAANGCGPATEDSVRSSAPPAGARNEGSSSITT